MVSFLVGFLSSGTFTLSVSGEGDSVGSRLGGSDGDAEDDGLNPGFCSKSVRIVAIDIAAGTEGVCSGAPALVPVPVDTNAAIPAPADEGEGRGGLVRLGVHELRWKLFFFLTLSLYAVLILESRSFAPIPATAVPRQYAA